MINILFVIITIVCIYNNSNHKKKPQSNILFIEYLNTCIYYLKIY